MANSFSSFLRPGVRVIEGSAGYRTAEVASHSTTYMIGSAANGSFITPTLVTSLTDFTNQFGASPSTASVKLFFNNNSEGVLYFVRSKIAPTFKVTITSIAALTYTLTINGVAVSSIVTVGMTTAQVAADFLSKINANVTGVTATAGSTTSEILVRSSNPTSTLTCVVTTGNMTAVDATPTTPAAADYVYAIQNSFDPDIHTQQGFLIAPEAFQAGFDAATRTSIASAMRDQCADGRFSWVALVDSNLTTVAALQTDVATYTAPRGHLAYYAPFLTDLDNTVVPPSAAVAAIAAKRYRLEGFQEPIGGAKYPISGVKDVVTRFNNTQQDTLNPLAVNLIRNLSYKGVVIWGMRTVSSDSLYKFIHTRVIMNVLNGSLRNAFDQYPFSSIDGQGVLLHQIEGTAISVCRKLYRAKALFGNSESDAFAVICNFDNNPPDQLEDGNVLLEVYAAPVPGLEKLLVATYRVGASNVQAAANLEI